MNQNQRTFGNVAIKRLWVETAVDVKNLHVDTDTGPMDVSGLKALDINVSKVNMSAEEVSIISTDGALSLDGTSITCNGKQVTDVNTPTNPSDAANKKYVDDKIVSVHGFPKTILVTFDATDDIEIEALSWTPTAKSINFLRCHIVARDENNVSNNSASFMLTGACQVFNNEVILSEGVDKASFFPKIVHQNALPDYDTKFSTSVDKSKLTVLVRGKAKWLIRLMIDDI
jgi:hypothetical protein